LFDLKSNYSINYCSKLHSNWSEDGVKFPRNKESLIIKTKLNVLLKTLIINKID